jgi:hypothetical protein
VVFQFPHSGQQRVHVNRALLRDFFEAACTVLAPTGQAVVTLKDRRPYSGWLLEEQAAQAGLRVVRSVPFDPNKFPGYRHVTTEAEAAVDGTHGFEVIFAKMSFFGRAASAAVATGEAAAPAASTAGVPERLMSADTDDAGANAEEVELRRKIIALGGEDPRKLLKPKEELRQPTAQLQQVRSTADMDRIVFSDTEGSELDEADSSGDDEFIRMMGEKHGEQERVPQATRMEAAEKIVFSDTDGSDLDGGDDEDEGALSSGDESFIAKMQRIHRPKVEPPRQQAQAHVHAAMTEEERHDAMLEAARKAARERREAARQAQAKPQETVPEQTAASAAVSLAGSTVSSAGIAADVDHAPINELQVRVGSRVRCLYPSDGGRYAATIVSVSKDLGQIEVAKRVVGSARDEIIVTVKWDDGDTQHTERPLSEVWPLTESDSDPEPADDFSQTGGREGPGKVNPNARSAGNSEEADSDGPVDVRAYAQRNRPVPAKEKAALLQKLQNAGRTAMLGKQKEAKNAVAASVAPVWPVPGQSLRLTSASTSKRASGNGGNGATKRRRKASSSSRVLVVQEV